MPGPPPFFYFNVQTKIILTRSLDFLFQNGSKGINSHIRDNPDIWTHASCTLSFRSTFPASALFNWRYQYFYDQTRAISCSYEDHSSSLSRNIGEQWFHFPSFIIKNVKIFSQPNIGMGICCELVKLFSGALDSNPRPSFPTQPCRKGSRLWSNEENCFHNCQSWDSNSCRVTTRKEWHPVNQSFIFFGFGFEVPISEKIGKYEKTLQSRSFSALYYRRNKIRVVP